MSKKSPKQTTGFLSTLNFISLAQSPTGTPIQQHCQMSNGFITAFNGSTSAGCKSDNDLEACPHTYNFMSAISKCGANLSITQLENSRLSVKSGKFSAIIPCFPEPFGHITPDAPCASISDDLIKSLGQVSSLAQETSSEVITSSVLIKQGSVFATTGYVVKESFHGIDLPTIALPKVFVTALCAVNKPVVSFGFSQDVLDGVPTPKSATFHYSDGSWLKSQLYAKQWPDLGRILHCESEFTTLPKGFFEAVRNLEEFSVGKAGSRCVWLNKKGIRSHKEEGDGAFYEMKGLPEMAFKIDQLKCVEDCCEQVSFHDNKLYAFGSKTRAVVMGVRV